MYKARSCGSIVRDKVNNRVRTSTNGNDGLSVPNSRHSALFCEKNRLFNLGARLLGSDSDINQQQQIHSQPQENLSIENSVTSVSSINSINLTDENDTQIKIIPKIENSKITTVENNRKNGLITTNSTKQLTSNNNTDNLNNNNNQQKMINSRRTMATTTAPTTQSSSSINSYNEHHKCLQDIPLCSSKC